MNNYIYQTWFRGKRKLQSEEDTLNYYLKHVHYPEYLKEEGKKAKKFLKTCNNVEEWARYAYANDLPFCVCKLDNTHVECYIRKELKKDNLSVSFLDEYQRVFMIYVFQKLKNGKYFCIGIMFWEFEDGKSGDDDDKKSWVYTFEPNGNVELIEREKDAKEEVIWKSKRPLNVESNWEPDPEFGDWEGLMNMKRWKPGELDEVFKGEDTKDNSLHEKSINRWLPPDWNKS